MKILRQQQYIIQTIKWKSWARSYHSEELFFPLCPCIVEDIGKTGKGKAKQELKGLQQNDCHKLNQLQTMQWWQPACVWKSLSK